MFDTSQFIGIHVLTISAFDLEGGIARYSYIFGMPLARMTRYAQTHVGDIKFFQVDGENEDDDPGPVSDDDLTDGEVAALVLGIIILVILLVVLIFLYLLLIWYYIRKHRKG